MEKLFCNFNFLLLIVLKENATRKIPGKFQVIGGQLFCVFINDLDFYVKVPGVVEEFM